jgi:hypothetical protein
MALTGGNHFRCEVWCTWTATSRNGYQLMPFFRKSKLFGWLWRGNYPSAFWWSRRETIYLAIFSNVCQLMKCYCPGIQIFSLTTSAPCERTKMILSCSQHHVGWAHQSKQIVALLLVRVKDNRFDKDIRSGTSFNYFLYKGPVCRERNHHHQTCVHR